MWEMMCKFEICVCSLELGEFTFSMLTVKLVIVKYVLRIHLNLHAECYVLFKDIANIGIKPCMVRLSAKCALILL